MGETTKIRTFVPHSFPKRAEKIIIQVMFNAYQYLRKNLSARLSVWVLASVTVLYLAVFVVMFIYTHRTVREESLEKADEMLNGTVQRIDNMMYQMEVSGRNMLWNIENHLDNPDAMALYGKKLVRSNRNIVGCAIAFEPNYYPEKGELFMSYSYWSPEIEDSVVTSHNPMEIEPYVMSGLPYPGHNWYFIPKKVGEACWIRPHAATDTILSSIITCGMPIREPGGRTVGVLAVDISLDWLSKTILATKPFPNSYCCMLGVQGTYLIHPDKTKLYHTLIKSVMKDEPDPRMGDVVNDMLAGNSGQSAVQLGGEDCYIIYKSLNQGHWSACMVCPESDIFAPNERLRLYMVAIALTGLWVILFFCLFFISRQLQPLDMLEESTQRIAKGEFDQTIPTTKRKDEIGLLQNSFSNMQKSLSEQVKEIHQLSGLLKERNDSLSEAYAKVQESDQMRTTFIHQIADNIIPPTKVIDTAISKLYHSYATLTKEDVRSLTKMVMAQIGIISEQLDKMTEISTNKKA